MREMRAGGPLQVLGWVTHLERIKHSRCHLETPPPPSWLGPGAKWSLCITVGRKNGGNITRTQTTWNRRHGCDFFYEGKIIYLQCETSVNWVALLHLPDIKSSFIPTFKCNHSLAKADVSCRVEHVNSVWKPLDFFPLLSTVAVIHLQVAHVLRPLKSRREYFQCHIIY